MPENLREEPDVWLPGEEVRGEGTDSIVLHGDSRWESPYVFSSFVALKEKGIPFVLRTMSLHDDEHRRGEYPARSMTGRQVLATPAGPHRGL